MSCQPPKQLAYPGLTEQCLLSSTDQPAPGRHNDCPAFAHACSPADRPPDCTGCFRHCWHALNTLHMHAPLLLTPDYNKCQHDCWHTKAPPIRPRCASRCEQAPEEAAPGAVVGLPEGLSGCPGHVEVAPGGHGHIVARGAAVDGGEAAFVVGGSADACNGRWLTRWFQNRLERTPAGTGCFL